MGLLGDHPHIVTVYDIGDEDGRPFIVSQYMPGGSVAEQLPRPRATGSRERVAAHGGFEVKSQGDGFNGCLRERSPGRRGA